MGQEIPGLNFDSNLSVDDLTFFQNVIDQQLLDRLKLVFGDPALGSPFYGIADSIDPRNIAESEVTRPLIAYPSTTTGALLKYNVTAGTAVFPSGAYVVLEDSLADVELVSDNDGDILVIFIENEIVNDPTLRITRYNTAQPPRLIQSDDKIRSALLSDWENASLFPPDRKQNVVALAVVRVVGTELQFDYTDSVYSFNRPWFSPRDVYHASHIGSGEPTTRNIHGLAYNDLVSGSLTIYDQINQTGIIQALDSQWKGAPGTLCSEAIEYSSVLTDTSGTLTSESRYGGAGAKYVVLSAYPNTVLSMYVTSHKSRSIAYDWIKGTRIIVLPSADDWSATTTESATIEYTRVYAAELPIASPTSNEITVGQPNSLSENIYSAGLSLDTLSNPSVDFDGSGAIPRNYTVYVDGDGTLIKSPQLLQGTVRLDDIGTAVFPITAASFGPAQFSIGLFDATPGVSMVVTIRIFGNDIDNTSVSEDITFDSNWQNPTVPGPENQNSYTRTETVFSQITGVQVLARANDGSNSKIVVWAELETGTTTDLNRLAPVAQIGWDGTTISTLRDYRLVAPQIPLVYNRFIAGQEELASASSAQEPIITDDLMMPIWAETTRGYMDATSALFRIYIEQPSGSPLVAGDIIKLSATKTLTATASLSPNRLIGEFTISATNTDVRDDIITTINTVGFASGFTATPDPTYTSANNGAAVICTYNIPGSRGNNITPTTANPVLANSGSALISGTTVGGYDTFGEIFLPRHQDYAKSPTPNSSVYEVTNYRFRYQSRAIPVGGPTSVAKRLRIKIHGADAVNTTQPGYELQVRVRVAFGTLDWEPWEVATVVTNTKTIFEINKTSNPLAITKCQVEVFGMMKGITVYEAAT